MQPLTNNSRDAATSVENMDTKQRSAGLTKETVPELDADPEAVALEEEEMVEAEDEETSIEGSASIVERKVISKPNVPREIITMILQTR